MTDNRTTELLDGLWHVGNLHEFAELFGFNWHDDSDWTWHDVAVKMADELEQAIAATLGSGTCEDVGERCDFACSECGARLYTEMSDGYTMILGDEETILLKPNYCPNCGRKVSA